MPTSSMVDVSLQTGLFSCLVISCLNRCISLVVKQLLFVSNKCVFFIIKPLNLDGPFQIILTGLVSACLDIAPNTSYDFNDRTDNRYKKQEK